MYASILRAIYATPWAILPEKLEAICAFVQLKAAGGASDTEVIAGIRADNAVSAARKQTVQSQGTAIAVLPLYGIINQRYAGDFSGPSGTSVQQFTQEFRQAVSDPSVKAIVIDIDSPGGSVSGVDELATEIFQARSKKKITAVSNCLCASAAYYLAAQATEVVVSPSSLTGSIGVYSAHQDDSEMLIKLGVKVTLISAGKYKVEGNGFAPLDPDALGAMQKMVDDFYGMFVTAVGRGRGVKATAVRTGFGEGRVLSASDAVKAGLADRVATLDDVLASYGVGTGASAAAQRSGPRATATQDVRMGDTDCTCPCDSCQSGDCAGCDCEGCESTSCANGECSCIGSASGDEDAAATARHRRLRLAQL